MHGHSPNILTAASKTVRAGVALMQRRQLRRMRLWDPESVRHLGPPTVDAGHQVDSLSTLEPENKDDHGH